MWWGSQKIKQIRPGRNIKACDIENTKAEIQKVKPTLGISSKNEHDTTLVGWNQVHLMKSPHTATTLSTMVGGNKSIKIQPYP